MPELPEVETIKQDLKKNILQKKIKDVTVLNEKQIKNNIIFFISNLIGNTLISINRAGKLLIFDLKNLHLLLHLKMTGQLIYITKNFKQMRNINKHTVLVIYFFDNSVLVFNDIRKFGYLKLVTSEEKNNKIRKLGIEPFTDDFTFENFKKLFKNSKVIIKSFLLDQTKISGIGNIYADEICYASKIKPERKVNTLSSKDIRVIYNQIISIMTKAIANRGSTFSNYVDLKGRKGNFFKYLKVYKKEGQKCRQCSQIIQKKKLAARSSYYCPNCQK
jgi:formamidopyrimidine-DNA glycosylase